jgi:PHP family Zn ribbon phosphoesterase
MIKKTKTENLTTKDWEKILLETGFMKPYEDGDLDFLTCEICNQQFPEDDIDNNWHCEKCANLIGY